MINVVFASDNNYVPYLMVSLNSLIVNNISNNIRIFILDYNISNKNKISLKDVIKDKNNFQMIFLNIDNLDNTLRISNNQKEGLLSINITSYSRLFLASLIPENIEKIIYFDCDSLIVNDISELWSIDIEDYMCAGVLDTTGTYFKNVVGLDDDDIYINAGMLLINLKQWRKENIEEKFMIFLEKNYGKNIHHDQGVINGVLNNQIRIIHPKYNLLGPFHGKDYDFVIKWFGINYDYYSKELIEEAQKNPVFLHFSGGSIERPWVNEKHVYRDLYDEYVDLISFDKKMIYRETGSISNIGKLYVKLSSNSFGQFLMKIFPKKLALLMKNYVIKRQSRL